MNEAEIAKLSKLRAFALRVGPIVKAAVDGMSVQIVDAQKQARTPRDVRGPWIRPKVPSKRTGRRGTRRAWKRKNAPHYVMFYREPSDVLVLHDRTIIATPQQADALRRASL